MRIIGYDIPEAEDKFLRLREYCRVKSWGYREYADFTSGEKKYCHCLKSVMSDLNEFDGILCLGFTSLAGAVESPGES